MQWCPQRTPGTQRDKVEGKLSERVICCAIEVSRVLGSGFLEKVYEAALAVELELAGIAHVRQAPVPVFYRNVRVGEYVCDFVIDGRLILEIKALRALAGEHEAQLLNYLKATGIQAGLLLNFGSPRLGIRRLVLNHDDACPI